MNDLPLKKPLLLVNYSLILLLTGLAPLASKAQEFRADIYDPTVNFYEVVENAEQYFIKHGREEGSGFKGFQRWRHQNEPSYYPDGKRSNRDFYFAAHAYENFLQQNSAVTGSPWRDLGPYFLGQITRHYSPGLGRVESFYVDPTDSNRLYLGSRSGGFWKSTDGGQSWQVSTTDFLPATGVNTMSVSPVNHDSILINARSARNGTSHGIYRSADGGNTWTLSNFNPANLGWGGLGSNEQVFVVKYHPLVAGMVLVGTSQGLFVSDDDLLTWTRKLNNAHITDIAFHPTDPDVIYFYDNRFGSNNENKIIITEDGALSFSTSPNLIVNNGSQMHLSVSKDCDSCIYAASNNGLWRSLNRGQSFSFLGDPPQSCDGFAVSDLDTSNMIVGFVDIYQSSNGGRSFVQVTDWNLNDNRNNGNVYSGKYVHADLRAAQCLNGNFYAATDGYLCVSRDQGFTWEILSDGTGIRENYSTGLCQGNDSLSVCGSQDNGTSIHIGSSWLEYTGGDGMQGLFHPLNHDMMMSSYQYGHRTTSTDGGLTLASSTRPHDNEDVNWEAPLIMDPLRHFHVYSFGESIFFSADFGRNWQKVGNNPFNGDIWHAAISDGDSSIIAVSTGRFLAYSTDRGKNFTSIWIGLPASSISDIAFVPGKDSTLLVTFATHTNNGKKIYMTEDLGNNWVNITGNLGDMPLRSVVVDHQNPPNIYVGGEIGVFTRPLNGGNWQLMNQVLPNCSVNDLKIMFGSNKLRAATWGRGLWETDLLNRANHPRIVHTTITETPTASNAPRSGIPQYVSSEIDYAGNISDVYLQWSMPDRALNNRIDMSLNNQGKWESTSPIPGMPEGVPVYFKVMAVGDQGDTSATAVFMYTNRFGVFSTEEELHQSFPVKVYPNPAREWLEVEFPESEQSTEVEIIDLSGRTQFSQVLPKGDKHVLDLSGLPAAAYLLSWRNGEYSGCVKFEKK